MAPSFLSKIWTKISNKKNSRTIMVVGLDNGGKTSIINRFITLINKQKAPFQDHYDNDDDNEFMVYLPVSNLERSYAEFQLMSSSISPTAGYNYEKIQYKDTTLMVLDFSGQNRYRNLWQEFYNCVDAIIFVVDSSDLIRFVVARDELENMLNHPFFTTLDNNSGKQSSSNAAVVQNPALAVQKQIIISQGKLIQSPLDSSTVSLSSRSNTNNATSMEHHKGRRTKIPILFMANKTDLSGSVNTEVISKALNLDQLSISKHPWFIQGTSVCASQGIFEGFDWLLSEFSAMNNC